MALLDEAKEVRAALAEVIRQEVETMTADCFRLKKAVVTVAPNGTRCSVKLVGDDTVLSIPYSSEAAFVSVGDTVWVAYWGGSMRNAIVWMDARFTFADRVNVALPFVTIDPYFVITSANVWSAYSGSQKAGIRTIPAGCTSVSFKPKSGSYIALLASFDTPVSGGTPDFADGFSGRIGYSSTSTVTIDLSQTNAAYLFYFISGSSGNDLEITNIRFS